MNAEQIKHNLEKIDFTNCLVKWDFEKWLEVTKTVLELDNVNLALVVKDALKEPCPATLPENTTVEYIAKWHLTKVFTSQHRKLARLKELRHTLTSYGKSRIR